MGIRYEPALASDDERLPRTVVELLPTCGPQCGDLSAGKVDVIVPGGPLEGGAWVSVSGAPRFYPGDHVVVGLVRATVGGRWTLSSFGFGTFWRKTSENGLDVVVDESGGALVSLNCQGAHVYATRPAAAMPPADRSTAEETGEPVPLEWVEFVRQVSSCREVSP